MVMFYQVVGYYLLYLELSMVVVFLSFVVLFPRTEKSWIRAFIPVVNLHTFGTVAGVQSGLLKKLYAASGTFVLYVGYVSQLITYAYRTDNFGLGRGLSPFAVLYRGPVMLSALYVSRWGFLILTPIFCYRLGKRFGKSHEFSMGLALLPMLFFPLLVFSSVRYQGGRLDLSSAEPGMKTCVLHEVSPRLWKKIKPLCEESASFEFCFGGRFNLGIGYVILFRMIPVWVQKKERYLFITEKGVFDYTTELWKRTEPVLYPAGRVTAITTEKEGMRHFLVLSFDSGLQEAYRMKDGSFATFLQQNKIAIESVADELQIDL